MATKPAANGYKANYTLVEARRNASAVTALTRKAFSQLDHMRDALGRPDYAGIYTIMGQMASELISLHQRHEELHALLKASVQPAGEDVKAELSDLRAELSDLQAEMAEMRDKLERMTDPIYPRKHLP